MPPTSPRNLLASLEQVYVADRAAWRQWLATNHATSPGIWLVFDKKSSRADRLAYVDAVEEAQPVVELQAVQHPRPVAQQEHVLGDQVAVPVDDALPAYPSVQQRPSAGEEP